MEFLPTKSLSWENSDKLLREEVKFVPHTVPFAVLEQEG